MLVTSDDVRKLYKYTMRSLSIINAAFLYPSSLSVMYVTIPAIKDCGEVTDMLKNMELSAEPALTREDTEDSMPMWYFHISYHASHNETGVIVSENFDCYEKAEYHRDLMTHALMTVGVYVNTNTVCECVGNQNRNLHVPQSTGTLTSSGSNDDDDWK